MEKLCQILNMEAHEFLPYYVTINEFLSKTEVSEWHSDVGSQPCCAMTLYQLWQSVYDLQTQKWNSISDN